MASASDMNGLGVPAGPGPQVPGTEPALAGVHPAVAGLRQRLLVAHAQASAAFDKTGELVARADRVRRGLTSLTNRGDLITPDDVMKEAGKLVGSGADPLTLAGLLADMPAEGGGEALAGWVNMHVAGAQATEAKISAAHEAAKHALGVSALHVMQAHSGMQAAQGVAAAGPPPATTNALAPTGAPEAPDAG